MLAVASIFALFAWAPAAAQERPQLPPGFAASVIVQGLALPTDLELLPNGDMLVSEKGSGTESEGVSHVRLIRDGVLSPEPVVTLSTNVQQDSGILGLIIDPEFDRNRYFYVWYATGAHALGAGVIPNYRLSRFTLDLAAGKVDASGEKIVVDGVPWSNTHGGGGLVFDAQGNLYIATGDAKNREGVQDLRELSGKILRIQRRADVYVAPEDNPYLGVVDARPEIYAMGLRNPFRMARHGSGLLVVGDVGDEKWEEVNVVGAAVDYGWPEREGPCVRDKREPCAGAPPQFTDPIHYYLHEGGGAITALAFYEGSAFPAQFHDVLFYADLDQAKISAVDLSSAAPSAQPFASELPGIVDLAYGDNVLYYVDIYRGEVGLIYYASSAGRAPQAILSADIAFGPAPLTVSLSADGSSDPNRLALRYRWDFGDGSPSLVGTEAKVSHRYAQDGTYNVRLQAVNVLNELSAERTQEIVVYSGEIPRIELTNLTEPGRAQFHGGDRWSYRAVRTGGTAGLDSDAPYRWRVDLHHNQHSHPIIVDQAAISETISLDDSLHGGAWDLWFRFYLTTRTEAEQEFTLFEEIRPAISSVDFGSMPKGAVIAFDDTRYWTDSQAKTIAGTVHSLAASPTMIHDLDVWAFDHWSTPAGAMAQRTLQVIAPTSAAAHTAHYVYDRPAQHVFLPLFTN
ncbi:MAG: PQQ-dependent sugar dehydrogenase [Caldilineaceae bacterium]